MELFEECPDCRGAGVYTAKNGDSWDCQFCGGSKVVTTETAKKQNEEWEEYKDMIKEYIDVEL